jgi:ribosome-associated heat shock protein Hsp15
LRPFRIRVPPTDPSSVRLDKWLWCVRLFKTRGLATDACRAGGVTVNGQPAKPARELRLGDVVAWRQGLVQRSAAVLGFPARRVSAKEAVGLCEDRTPLEEWSKATASRVEQVLARERGSGRPTKRDRRRLDRLFP